MGLMIHGPGDNKAIFDIFPRDSAGVDINTMRKRLRITANSLASYMKGSGYSVKISFSGQTDYLGQEIACPFIKVSGTNAVQVPSINTLLEQVSGHLQQDWEQIFSAAERLVEIEGKEEAESWRQRAAIQQGQQSGMADAAVALNFFLEHLPKKSPEQIAYLESKDTQRELAEAFVKQKQLSK